MNPVSMIVLIVSITILVITGVLPSYLNNDWGWFGRSGALLTAFGIAITFADFVGIWEKSIPEIIGNVRTDLSDFVIPADFVAQEGKPATMEEAEEHFSREFASSLKWTELKVLISGTVIWGYGDLLNHVFQIAEYTP